MAYSELLEGKNMQKQKELRRLVTVLLAACLMAVNIKTFVRAGGLYPGGATGLTILFQRMAETFLHWEVPYTLINVSLNAIPVYIGFVILGAAGLMFGWDKALYSIIFQYVSTQMIHLLYRGFQQMTLFIVTDKPKEVCEAIYRISHHGATIMEGEGSYGHHAEPRVSAGVDAPDTSKVI